MPTTSGDNKPPTGTIDAACAMLEWMQKHQQPNDAEILYQYEHAYTETDMDLWPNDKAVVLVETVDGQRIALCEFSKNQEAADFMFTYFRKPVNITYKPIGARRECFNMESHELPAERDLFLDIMLDIL